VVEFGLWMLRYYHSITSLQSDFVFATGTKLLTSVIRYITRCVGPAQKVKRLYQSYDVNIAFISVI
jgi:hypothetical protein